MAFTVVLAEVFAAVGLSTLIPNVFVQLCRALKLTGDAALTGVALDTVLGILVKGLALPGLPAIPAATADAGTKGAYEAKLQMIKNHLIKAVQDTKKMQLLVPNKATIDAEFSCSGGESYGYEVGAEGVIEVVGVKGGFSALYEMKSSMTIRMHVEFAPVEYDL